MDGLRPFWTRCSDDGADDRADRDRERRLAFVLTHAHSDHTGFAEASREETGASVYVHGDDESLAATGKPSAKNEASFMPDLRYRHAWRLLTHLARERLKPQPIRKLTTYADGETLDVPGRPRVIHTPGHTSGHCALWLESAGALIVGDELCTLHPLTGARGPQLMPRAFNLSSVKCLGSLTRLDGVDAEVLAVGHGESWREGVAAAVEQARATGPT